MLSDNDSYMKRDRQSFSKYTKIAKRIALVSGIILVVVVFLLIKNRVDGPDEILSLTSENYHDVTSIVTFDDEESCKRHLSLLEEELPTYIEQIVVTSDNGFTKCISVRYAVSLEELKKSYLIDTKKFKDVIKNLKERGIISESDLERIQLNE